MFSIAEPVIIIQISVVVTRHSSLNFNFISQFNLCNNLPTSSDSRLMPSSMSQSSLAFFFDSSSPFSSSSSSSSLFFLDLSSAVEVPLFQSISLIFLGNYFISYFPERWLLSRLLIVPQALHLDLRDFLFKYIDVSGYLHLVHNKYFSINLQKLLISLLLKVIVSIPILVNLNYFFLRGENGLIKCGIWYGKWECYLLIKTFLEGFKVVLTFKNSGLLTTSSQLSTEELNNC